MKRIIAIIITLCTLCCLIFTGCNQAENNRICSYCGADIMLNAKYCAQCGQSASIETTEEVFDYEILDSGRCNANISWEIRSYGTLYIYGNGAVPSYEDREVDGQIAPWRASPLVSEITDVVIGDDISGLGENLFCGLTLNTLYLGRNVRVFDHNFKYFYAKNIYIPKCFGDIYFLLCEASAEQVRYDEYPITVYYEGTEEDWNKQKEATIAWRQSERFGESFQDVTIHFSYKYDN